MAVACPAQAYAHAACETDRIKLGSLGGAGARPGIERRAGRPTGTGQPDSAHPGHQRVDGAVPVNNEFPDFVDCVERQARRDDVDGIYVFADFHWSWTPEGLRRATQALEPTGWRLYLETIDLDPSPELVRLVEASGGAVIRTPK